MSLVCKWRVFWWRCLGSDALLGPGVMRLQETCWQLILVKGSRGGKLRHNKPKLKSTNGGVVRGDVAVRAECRHKACLDATFHCLSHRVT